VYRRTRRRSAYRPIQGFTLIEALVAVVLVAIGVVGVMSGIRSINQADSKARVADLLQRLAAQKLSTIGVMQDPSTDDQKGDFQDQGYPNITWTMDVQPSGADNVDQITITATRGEAVQTIMGLVFVRPQTSTTSDAGGTTGGTQ